MLAPFTDDHSNRLAAFNIGDRDIAALQRQRDRVVERLPSLLSQLDRTSMAGPQVTKGLADLRLKHRRDAYWECIASGQLGESFVAAATLFARTSYAKGIPSKAFTIRHSSGAGLLVDGLFGGAVAPSRAPWVGRLARLGSGGGQRAEYASAVQKALWLGLSIVLEAYAQVEAEANLVAIRRIEQSFSDRIANVADVLGAQVIALEGAVVSVSTSAEQTTTSADILADDAYKASQAVRDISASTDGLARSVGEIGARIAQCARSVGDAVGQARLGDSAVARFADSTAAIDQVTALINGIADRTKLLALNAGIEAVRAGQYGRGFAVVASEVSNLAKETSSAITRVSQQVDLIRQSAQESSTAIHALTGKIEEVSTIASVIASSVLQQDAAMQAIVVSLKQAALGNEKVSQLTTAMKVEASRSLDLAGVLGKAAAGIGLQGNMVRDITQTFMSDVHATQRPNGSSQPEDGDVTLLATTGFT